MLQLAVASAASASWTRSSFIFEFGCGFACYSTLLFSSSSSSLCALHAAIISTKLSVTQPEQGCPTQWPGLPTLCNRIACLPQAFGLIASHKQQIINQNSSRHNSTQLYEEAQLNQLLNANRLIFVSPFRWLLDLFIKSNLS